MLSSNRSHSIPLRRTSFSALSFVRDSALFTYILIYFTAISFLFLPGSLDAEHPDVTMEGSLFWQAAVTIFLGLGILLQVFGQTPVRRVLATAAPLLPIMIWILLSVTWSEFPDYSLRRAIRLVMETTAIILFAAAYSGDHQRLLRVIHLGFSFILIVDVALIALPEISFTEIGYAGVHVHKNSTGYFCLLALPVFILGLIDRRISPFKSMSIVMVLGCLLVLWLSLAKTSEALAFVCIPVTIIFVWLARTSPITTFIAALNLVVVGTVMAVIIYSMGTDNFLTYTVGDPTITGRDKVWRYALSLFWQSPIVGRGYGGVWNVGVYSVLSEPLFGEHFVVKHAHNGYIDVMLETGIVGLLLAIIFIMCTFYRLWTRARTRNIGQITFIAVYTTFAILLENATSSSLFKAGTEFWIYFLLVTHVVFLMNPPQATSPIGKASRNCVPTAENFPTEREAPPLTQNSMFVKIASSLRLGGELDEMPKN